MKMDLGTLMNLIVAWMSVLIITLDISQGAQLTDDFDFEKDTKSALFSIPTDDDESDDFSGAYLGRFPSFPPIDDEEILVYERTPFDKLPTEVDVFIPDEENDSMQLDDIKNLYELDEDLGPGMLQSNEFDSDPFLGGGTYAEDCAALQMLGIVCNEDEVVGPDEKPATTTEDILQTTATKAATTPLDTTHKQEMKTLPDQSSPTAQDHQPEPTTKPNEIVVTSKESTHTTTKISVMPIATTTAIKPVDSSAVTSHDTKLVVPEIIPVTDKSEREGHSTGVKPKPEVPQGTTAIARDATPHPTKPVAYTKPQMTPGVMTRSMTMKTPNVATQLPTKTAMQSGEEKEQPVDTALPPGDVQSTTELEDTAGKEEVASTFPPSFEETTTKKVSDMSKSKVPKTTQVEQQTTDSVESEKLPTVPKEAKPEPPSAVTSKSKVISEETTAMKQAAPQQAQFSTIVLVVCIISLLIVLVLVIVIIVIVRARLKKRGKYAITSEVDSAEGAASVEGGKSDVARGSGEKVVTVQYNDANA